MKKLFIAMMALTAASTASFAQAGLNQISIGPEVNIPTGDLSDEDEGVGLKTGFGGSIKGLFGIGTAGQITLTGGYTVFKFKGIGDDIKANYHILPVLAGYRHNFSGFYVEPQVGFGNYGIKIEDESESKGAFTYAVGLGYAMGPVDIGVRYQDAKVKFEGDDEGFNSSIIGIRVAYVLNLGSRAVNRK